MVLGTLGDQHFFTQLPRFIHPSDVDLADTGSKRPNPIHRYQPRLDPGMALAGEVSATSRGSY